MANSIRVSLHITRNLGNFNSLKLGAEREVEIDESADLAASWEGLWEELKGQVEGQLDEAEEDGVKS